MIVEFTKMHSLGNDFVVIDMIGQYVKLYPTLVQRICDRLLGIGCDQLLTLEPPTQPDSDFFYRVFNQDGHEVEQCGNGARCLAQYMFDQKLTNKTKLSADCQGGPVSLHILKNRQVSLCLNSVTSDIQETTIKNEHGTFELLLINVGNPHAVLILDNLDRSNTKFLNEVGHAISTSDLFPKGCNVGFAQILSKQEMSLQVYERGAGLTAACGTGAFAAMMSARLKDLIDDQVKVHFLNGYLKFQYHTEKKYALMAGPTTTSYSGSFRL